MSETIFTKIINRELPANIVYEDELIIVFHDINPKAPVHLLLVPKKPIPTLADVSAEEMNLITHIHLEAQRLAKELGFEGWRMLINVGEKGGQEVFHLHYHLMGWPKE